MRVLIVEDEPRLAKLIRTGLLEEGYAVDVSGLGRDALERVMRSDFDSIVLDIMLPDIDGLSICRALRTRGVRTPILMLTARDAIEDRIAGLDAGADDYLIKPFAFAELTARLRALGRRPPDTLTPILTVGDLRLDPATRQVWREGQEHKLPNKEFRMLEYFMRHPNQVLTRNMIAEHVWDYEFLNATNVIDVHIRALRRKIDDPYPVKRVVTIRGAGYKLVGDGD
ncbi:MAG TPA: response regulator transcription factor [Nitrolancea sp.]|jgi:two-component system OmpR family response regulator|nr:response regulator transcription factor [Nitrolancea sp.]